MNLIKSPSAEVRPETQSGARLYRHLAAVVLGALLLTLSAKVQIPFWPVPMTLQMVAVMGLALLLGPRLAVAAFATYLAAGAVGLPVFAGTPARGIGLAYMTGPTGGYLAGFLLASALVGRLAGAAGGLWRNAAALLAGLLVVYGAGAGWLCLFVPPARVLEVGVLPFLAGDLLKVALVAVGFRLLPGLAARVRGYLE